MVDNSLYKQVYYHRCLVFFFFFRTGRVFLYNMTSISNSIANEKLSVGRVGIGWATE
jgi:hypothetical protein